MAKIDRMGSARTKAINQLRTEVGKRLKEQVLRENFFSDYGPVAKKYVKTANDWVRAHVASMTPVDMVQYLQTGVLPDYHPNWDKTGGNKELYDARRKRNEPYLTDPKTHMLLPTWQQRIVNPTREPEKRSKWTIRSKKGR